MRPTPPCSAGYHPQVRRLRIVSQGRAAAEKAGEAEAAARRVFLLLTVHDYKVKMNMI